MANDARRRKRVRFTLDVNFDSEIAKTAFSDRLTAVRDLLTPSGAPRLDNKEFLLALFDRATTGTSAVSSSCALHASDARAEHLLAPSTGSFLRNSGVFELR